LLSVPKRELPELVAKFDVQLSGRNKPTERLLKMSRPLRAVYAAMFLDCAPDISPKGGGPRRGAFASRDACADPCTFF
jgi:hypothetical protein